MVEAFNSLSPDKTGASSATVGRTWCILPRYFGGGAGTAAPPALRKLLLRVAVHRVNLNRDCALFRQLKIATSTWSSIAASIRSVACECRVHPFLNNALVCALTVRASPDGFPTLLVLAEKAPSRFSRLDNDVISGKPLQHVKESAKSGVSSALRVERHICVTTRVGRIGSSNMPYQRIGQPGTSRDLGPSRVVEAIPCELKIPDVDKDSNTHGNNAGSLERLPRG